MVLDAALPVGPGGCPWAWGSSRGSVLNQFKVAVAGHAVREVLGEVVGKHGVNGVLGFGFLVADIDKPNGDFLAVVVGVGLGAAEEYAAPIGCWMPELAKAWLAPIPDAVYP